MIFKYINYCNTLGKNKKKFFFVPFCIGHLWMLISVTTLYAGKITGRRSVEVIMWKKEEKKRNNNFVAINPHPLCFVYSIDLSGISEPFKESKFYTVL